MSPGVSVCEPVCPEGRWVQDLRCGSTEEKYNYVVLLNPITQLILISCPWLGPYRKNNELYSQRPEFKSSFCHLLALKLNFSKSQFPHLYNRNKDMVCYCGHHFVVYTNVKSLCFTPEINMMYVNYTLKNNNLSCSQILRVSNLDKAQ